MRRLLFNIRCSMSNIKKNKFMNIIMVLSLSFGLLLSSAVLCIGNSIINDFMNSIPKEIERVIVMEGSHNLEDEYKVLSQRDMDTVIKDNKGIESISRLVMKRQTTKINDIYVFNNMVKYVSFSYADFFNNLTENGVWFNPKIENAAKECIIGKDIAKKYYFNKKAIGNNVTVNGEDYKIIAISEQPLFKESIVINILSDGSLSNEKSMSTYYIKFAKDCDVGNAAQSLKKYIHEFFGEYELKNAETQYNQMKIIYRGTVSALMLCTFLVLLFSMLNIINIVLFKINESKKKIAVLMALGARKLDIVVQTFIELLFLVLIAVIIVYFVFLQLLRIILNDTLFIFKIDLNIFLLSVLLGVIVAIIINSITTSRILKFEIAEMIRR